MDDFWYDEGSYASSVWHKVSSKLNQFNESYSPKDGEFSPAESKLGPYTSQLGNPAKTPMGVAEQKPEFIWCT